MKYTVPYNELNDTEIKQVNEFKNIMTLLYLFYYSKNVKDIDYIQKLNKKIQKYNWNFLNDFKKNLDNIIDSLFIFFM